MSLLHFTCSLATSNIFLYLQIDSKSSLLYKMFGFYSQKMNSILLKTVSALVCLPVFAASLKYVFTCTTCMHSRWLTGTQHCCAKLMFLVGRRPTKLPDHCTDLCIFIMLLIFYSSSHFAASVNTADNFYFAFFSWRKQDHTQNPCNHFCAHDWLAWALKTSLSARES